MGAERCLVALTKGAKILHEYLLCCVFGFIGVFIRLYLVLGMSRVGLTHSNGPFGSVQPANIVGCFIMGVLQSTKLTWFKRYFCIFDSGDYPLNLPLF